MASINIIKPRYGTITILNSDPSSYTVRYDPPDGESVDFNGFKVFCNACHQYLYTSTANPSTFDIQNLEDTGHPGPFDISADTHADVEFLLRTWPDDPKMGTTTPDIRWIPGEVGHTITYTIKATPNDGYVFDKWVSSTGSEYTGATHTFSVRLDFDDGRDYVAYFKKKTHRAYIRIRGQGLSNADGKTQYPIGNPRIVRVKDGKTGAQVDVAKLYDNYVNVATDDSVTFNLEVYQAFSLYGVKFLGFRVQEGTYEDGSFVEDSHSVTVTSDGTGRIVVDAWFTVSSVVVTLKLRNHIYGNLTAYDTGRAIVWDGSTSSYSEAPILKSDFPNGTFSWLVPASDYALEHYYLFLEWGGVTDPRAFVHGTSSDRCQIGYFPMVPYYYSTIRIKYTNEDETFYIYLCTHLLVYEPNHQSIEMKPPELLYDCNRLSST